MWKFHSYSLHMIMSAEQLLLVYLEVYLVIINNEINWMEGPPSIRFSALLLQWILLSSLTAPVPLSVINIRWVFRNAVMFLFMCPCV